MSFKQVLVLLIGGLFFSSVVASAGPAPPKYDKSCKVVVAKKAFVDHVFVMDFSVPTIFVYPRLPYATALNMVSDAPVLIGATSGLSPPPRL